MGRERDGMLDATNAKIVRKKSMFHQEKVLESHFVREHWWIGAGLALILTLPRKCFWFQKPFVSGDCLQMAFFFISSSFAGGGRRGGWKHKKISSTFSTDVDKWPKQPSVIASLAKKKKRSKHNTAKNQSRWDGS